MAELPCQSGFWVHNHPDITGSTGPFPTQLLAAKFIVEQTGVSMSDLKKKDLLYEGPSGVEKPSFGTRRCLVGQSSSLLAS